MKSKANEYFEFKYRVCQLIQKDFGLTGKETAFLISVMARMRDHNGTVKCWPTLKQIGADVGIGVNSCHQIRRNLIKKGWLESRREVDDNGGQRHNFSYFMGTRLRDLRLTEPTNGNKNIPFQQIYPEVETVQEMCRRTGQVY